MFSGGHHNTQISKLLVKRDRDLFLREFVDRKDLLQWLHNLYEYVTTSGDFKVVVLVGMGGVGKTWLIKRFELDVVDTIKIHFDTYNYGGFSSFSRILFLIYSSLKQFGYDLNAFEILFSLYTRLLEGKDSVKELKDRISDEILVLIKAIPGLSQVVSIAELAGIIGHKFYRFISKHFSKHEKWLVESFGKNYVDFLVEVIWEDPKKFLFILIDALAYDLSISKKRKPIILVFDGFEHIISISRRESSRGQVVFIGDNVFSLEDLFLYLSRSLSQCFSIYLSREIPSWAKNDLSELNIEVREIRPLNCDDIELYLGRHNISDIETVESIKRLSKGFPLLMSLLANYCKRSGCFDIDFFDSSTDLSVKLMFSKVLNRLISHLPQKIQSLIYYAAVPRFFDMNILSLVCDEPINYEDYMRLTELSFIILEPNKVIDVRSVHNLAREIIVNSIPSKQLEKICERLSKAFMKRYKETGVIDYLAEYFYVKSLINETSAGIELEKFFWSLFKRTNFEWSKILLEAYEPKETVNIIRKLTMYSRLYMKFAKYHEIIKELRWVYNLEPNGEEERRVFGRALLNLGRAYLRIGELNEAKRVLNRGQEFLKMCYENHDCVRNSGHIEIELSKVNLLESNYEGAIKHLYNAESSYTRAINLTEEKDHNMWRNRGRTLLFLAELLFHLKRMDEITSLLDRAKQDLEKAYRISEGRDLLTLFQIARLELMYLRLNLSDRDTLLKTLENIEKSMIDMDINFIVFSIIAYIYTDNVTKARSIVNGVYSKEGEISPEIIILKNLIDCSLENCSSIEDLIRKLKSELDRCSFLRVLLEEGLSNFLIYGFNVSELFSILLKQIY